MTNNPLIIARKNKNDEFYTRLCDIEKEISAYIDYDPTVFKNKTILLPCDDPEYSHFTGFFINNFSRLQLKQLISTSYVNEDNKKNGITRGKILKVDKYNFVNNAIHNSLHWNYLHGDGDFRSEEITNLCATADIIITNPPFSLFRDFINWIMQAKKKFLIIGNPNAIIYKEIFPFIRNNEMWTGTKPMAVDMLFEIPDNTNLFNLKKEWSGYKIINGQPLARASSIWFTNLEHGKRHQPLKLKTMQENILSGKHKIIKERGYRHYDNYDAIDVPYADSIPADYEGVMGVPVSIMDNYCPEQFRIIGRMTSTKIDEYNFGYPYIDGKRIYARLLIKRK